MNSKSCLSMTVLVAISILTGCGSENHNRVDDRSAGRSYIPNAYDPAYYDLGGYDGRYWVYRDHRGHKYYEDRSDHERFLRERSSARSPTQSDAHGANHDQAHPNANDAVSDHSAGGGGGHEGSNAPAAVGGHDDGADHGGTIGHEGGSDHDGGSSDHDGATSGGGAHAGPAQGGGGGAHGGGGSAGGGGGHGK